MGNCTLTPSVALGRRLTQGTGSVSQNNKLPWRCVWLLVGHLLESRLTYQGQTGMEEKCRIGHCLLFFSAIRGTD